MKALIDYLQSLTITQGQGRGQPFKLLPWERRFVRGAFGQPDDAALSVGRGNGKTTLIAGIGAATLDGPLRVPRAETVITASSLDQSRIDFVHTRAFLEAKGHDLSDKKTWRVADSFQRASIEHRPTGAVLRCIGSDPKRAHGLAPLLVIGDEPSQWPTSTSDAMYAALRTSMGKIPGARMIALGTRPASPDHWFERLLNGGAGYAQCHKADPAHPPFQLKTMRMANPSLSAMPALLKRIRAEARDAKRDPSLLPMFQALRLNLGVADTEVRVLISVDAWRAAEGQAEPDGDYILGLDLGQTAAMSAAAAYWPKTGFLTALACFGSEPGLQERGLLDGVGRLYVNMWKRKELLLSEGKTSKPRDLLAAVLERWGRPSVIVADRWRLGELYDTLNELRIRCDLVSRGMGWQDGAADVRDFRRSLAEGRIIHDRNLLLTAAISEARTLADPAGNEKLSKGSQGGRRKRARDDACAAAILATAEGYRRNRSGAVRRPAWRYRGAIG